MSLSSQESVENVVSIGTADANAILRSLRQLRELIVTTWQERAVMLTREEQAELHREIQETCDFLRDLTRHP